MRMTSEQEMQLESFEMSMNEAFKHNDADAMLGIFNDELFNRLRTERAVSDTLSPRSAMYSRMISTRKQRSRRAYE